MIDLLKKVLVCTSLVIGLPLFHAYLTAPRPHAVSETPLAFWAWRREAPLEADVIQAVNKTAAQKLFIRAGQFDCGKDGLRRIRPVVGRLPQSTEIHLVYNATRDLLENFESINPHGLADVVSATYNSDIYAAQNAGARIRGVQLDIDVPTRLLDRYETSLRLLRPMLPAGTELSITGLPSWMDSPKINDLLRQVDFWTPQFYGAVIPRDIESPTPISSPASIRRVITAARELDRPFYAGLSAYGYAILYSTGGNLIELRGDIDPRLIISNPNLEKVERRVNESIHLYKVRSDQMIDGMAMRQGDFLMLDLPNAETLRASARAVREEAGDQLLGICVFRLPTTDDHTNLTINEIADAIADRDPVSATDLKLEQDQTPGDIRLTAENTGSASIEPGGVFAVDVRIPQGGIENVFNVSGFTSYETLCSPTYDGFQAYALPERPCSRRRADILRFKTPSWSPGSKATATIRLNTKITTSISATYRSTKSEQKRLGQTFGTVPGAVATG